MSDTDEDIARRVTAWMHLMRNAPNAVTLDLNPLKPDPIFHCPSCMARGSQEWWATRIANQPCERGVKCGMRRE